MYVPNGPRFNKWWEKAIPNIGSGFLVGYFINLAKWAKIVISEQIWLKFRMNVTNGP